jgi:hypothetical protein
VWIIKTPWRIRSVQLNSVFGLDELDRTFADGWVRLILTGK